MEDDGNIPETLAESEAGDVAAAGAAAATGKAVAGEGKVVEAFCFDFFLLLCWLLSLLFADIGLERRGRMLINCWVA